MWSRSPVSQVVRCVGLVNVHPNMIEDERGERWDLKFDLKFNSK